MTLGQKLKQARLARGMTQSQVVGDRITRNMLSQIENDLASPSVGTLEYLASVLNVRLSWLLADEEEEAETARTQRLRECLKTAIIPAVSRLRRSMRRMTSRRWLWRWPRLNAHGRRWRPSGSILRGIWRSRRLRGMRAVFIRAYWLGLICARRLSAARRTRGPARRARWPIAGLPMTRHRPRSRGTI